MNAGRPSFSVLVPAYNYGRYVGAALDSLLAQTDPDWEAVVVDDGSTDDTPAVIDAYGARDSRIRLIRKSNGGASSALNLGMREARGEWLLWLSADDLFDPRKLEIHRAWLQRRPECRFFFTHFRHLQDATGQLEDPPPWRRIPEARWQVLEMLESNYLSGITICVHREALAAAGPFDEVLKYSQDYDMWLRLLPRAPACYIDERTAVTRCHAAQFSNAQRGACFFDSAKIAIKFLNAHRFDALFPLLDLSDPAQARLALDHAIDAAANPHAFLYKLGAHPALIARIMEWLWALPEGREANRRRAFFRRRAAECAGRFAGTALGWYWRAADAAAREWQGAAPYRAVNVADVGLAHYAALGPEQQADRDDLRAFLNRFENVEVAEPAGQPSRQAAIFVGQPDAEVTAPVVYGALRATLEVARGLLRAGRPTLLLGISANPLGIVEGVPFAGARHDVAVKRLVRRLDGAGVFVAVGRADTVADAVASQVVVYHHSMHYVPGGVPARDLARTGTHVICVSEYSRGVFRAAGVDTASLHVVRNGFERNLFQPCPAVPRGPHRLVFAGNVCDYKGFDIALAAYAGLRAAVPDVTLDVFGLAVRWPEDAAGHMRPAWLAADRLPAWEHICAALPGVSNHGEVPPARLADALRADSLLVMPSRSENCPLIALEAQACGCIPVLPRVGGIPETLRDGETGFLYSPNTPEQLVQTVRDLWARGLPDAAMRARAAAHAAAWHAWSQSAAAFEAVLARIPGRTAAQQRAAARLRLTRRVANKLARLRGAAQ